MSRKADNPYILSDKQLWIGFCNSFEAYNQTFIPKISVRMAEKGNLANKLKNTLKNWFSMENTEQTNQEGQNPENVQATAENSTAMADEMTALRDENVKIKQQLEEAKEKYLRLYADFDNFRRRSAKEKTDFLKTANEGLMLAILPALDDFERAKKTIDTQYAEDDPARQGVGLIFQKMFKILEAKGLKQLKAQGEIFDPEIHDAITQIPAPSDDLKGKVVDEIEKGYYLEDKLIRVAKVIVGA
jgi:molecular chaperone GrpE